MWIKACDLDDIDDDDLIRWDHEGRTYAIYKTPLGVFATAGHCTHEEQHLEDGLVIDGVIECPLHGGRFDIATGKALSAPCTVDLKTYPAKVESDAVFVDVA